MQFHQYGLYIALSIQALNWLVRNVTQPTCLHDLFWFFVASLSTASTELEEEEEGEGQKKEKREEQVKYDDFH